MEGQVANEQSVDVQQELLAHSQQQTQLLRTVASHLQFFVILAWVSIGLVILYFLISLSN